MSKIVVQKLMGAALIVLGILSTAISNDATAACVLIPMGAWMAVSKRVMIL